MGAEHLDQAFVFGTVLFQALELEAGGAECARGCMAQAPDRGARFRADIDEVLGQRTDDAVATGIDLADLAAIPGAPYR